MSTRDRRYYSSLRQMSQDRPSGKQATLRAVNTATLRRELHFSGLVLRVLRLEGQNDVNFS